MPPGASAKISGRYLPPVAIGALLIAVATIVPLASDWWTSPSRLRLDSLGAIGVQTVALVSHITDAETMQRGYLLTAQESYLDAYDKSKADLDDDSRLIDALIDGDAVMKASSASIAENVRLKLAEMDLTISVTKSGDIKGALDIVISGEGRDVMLAIKKSASELNDQVLRSKAAFRAKAESQRVAVGFGTFLPGIFGCLTLVAWLKSSRRQEIKSRLWAEMSERRLRSLHDAAPVGMALLDAGGRFVEISGRLAEIDGIPLKDHMGRHLRDIFPVGCADEAICLHAKALSGEDVTEHNMSGMMCVGVPFHWQVSFLPATSGDEPSCVRAVSLFVTDVTGHSERVEQQGANAPNCSGKAPNPEASGNT